MLANAASTSAPLPSSPQSSSSAALHENVSMKFSDELEICLSRESLVISDIRKVFEEAMGTYQRHVERLERKHRAVIQQSWLPEVQRAKRELEKKIIELAQTMKKLSRTRSELEEMKAEIKSRDKVLERLNAHATRLLSETDARRAHDAEKLQKQVIELTNNTFSLQKELASVRLENQELREELVVSREM